MWHGGSLSAHIGAALCLQAVLALKLDAPPLSCLLLLPLPLNFETVWGLGWGFAPIKWATIC